MSNWQQKIFEKLKTLFDLLKRFVKSGSVIRMDETTVQVTDEENRNDAHDIENELRNKNLEDEKFLAERKARAGPVLEKFK